jgi:hypothetical protein
VDPEQDACLTAAAARLTTLITLSCVRYGEGHSDRSQRHSDPKAGCALPPSPPLPNPRSSSLSPIPLPVPCVCHIYFPSWRMKLVGTVVEYTTLLVDSRGRHINNHRGLDGTELGIDKLPWGMVLVGRPGCPREARCLKSRRSCHEHAEVRMMEGRSCQ